MLASFLHILIVHVLFKVQQPQLSLVVVPYNKVEANIYIY